MNEQVTLTATVQNLKRLVKFLNHPRKKYPNKATAQPSILLFGLIRLAQGFLLLARVELALFAKGPFIQINQMALLNG